MTITTDSPRRQRRKIDEPKSGIQTSMVVTTLIAVAALIITFIADSGISSGAAAMVLLLALLMLRIPIGVALGASGVVGILALAPTPQVAWNSLATLPFDASASWTLSVLPMFILMGVLMWHAGLTDRIYDAARVWLGWLPGGLAVTTSAAGAGMASASGSTLGITYALGRIAPPEMLKSGYDRRLALGSVMTAGTVGNLIPPSILLVVFAGVAQTPVGPQLMAGLIPGLLLAGGYIVAIIIASIIAPKIAGGRRTQKSSFTWKERGKALLRIWPIPVLSLVVLGGLFGGVMTPTEAGAAGAAGAVLLALFVMGARKGARAIWSASIETAASVGAIMFVLIGAALFNQMLILSGLARAAASMVAEADLSRFQLVAVLMVVLLLLGMFLEPAAMILLVVPIMMPIINASDLSMVWFGVFVVLMAEIAAVTPPVGLLTFVMHKISQRPEVNLGHRITLGDVFVAGLMFVPIALLLVVAMTAFPEIVEILPQMTG